MGSIADAVATEVLGWPATAQVPHRFGGIELRAFGHEMGHLHGDRQADLPFPVRVREELVASGLASPHHMFPQTGWVTYYMRGEGDIAKLIALFRRNYERIAAADEARQMRASINSHTSTTEDEP